MAAPWEDTIVTALRDAQWMSDHVGMASAPKMPDLFVKLDGHTEKALGDVAYEVGARFYLFEVKSSKAAIATEWNKKTKEGNPKRKAAFNSLSHLMNLTNAAGGEKFHPAFLVSLRCHHFVYWSDDVFDVKDTFGNIMVEPYILACAKHADGLMPDRWDGRDYAVAERITKGSYLSSTMLPLSAIRKHAGHVAVRDPSEQEKKGRAMPMGETFGVFLKYLTFLLAHGGGGDGALNAVLYSDRGRFSKKIASVADLRRELASVGDFKNNFSAESLPSLTRTSTSLERDQVKPSGALTFPAPKPKDPHPSSTLTFTG